MKIKNDLVSIKIGNKKYDFHNLIFDEYLKTFAVEQMNINNIRVIKNMKALRYLLVKFNTPIENITEKSLLKNEDFDICFVFGSTFSYNQNTSDNSIITQYKYETDDSWNVWDYEKGTANNTYLNNYYGKKITAIGFNTYWTPSTSNDNPVKAFLNVSDYNIYLQKNQEFSVIRKDIITTDSLFYSNNKNKVPAPLHLMPNYNKAVITPTVLIKEEGNFTYYKSGIDESYGVIYSVGLSSFTDRIDKEFIIGENVEITQNGTGLEIEGIENYWSNENLLYPNSNLYPSSNLYPIKSNYKYIILKYKVWQNILSGTYENPVHTMTDTGYFYYQAIPITLNGELNLKIKYERG